MILWGEDSKDSRLWNYRSCTLTFKQLLKREKLFAPYHTYIPEGGQEPSFLLPLGHHASLQPPPLWSPESRRRLTYGTFHGQLLPSTHLLTRHPRPSNTQLGFDNLQPCQLCLGSHRAWRQDKTGAAIQRGGRVPCTYGQGGGTEGRLWQRVGECKGNKLSRKKGGRITGGLFMP